MNYKVIVKPAAVSDGAIPGILPLFCILAVKNMVVNEYEDRKNYTG